MSIFDLIKDVVLLPVAVIKDVATLGGVLIDEEPQIKKQLEKIDKELFGEKK